LTNSVLITGASGLIGQRLTEWLLQKGCRVSHLGRTNRQTKVPSFSWNIAAHSIQPGAFNGVDTVIHLAGANIADKRWTTDRRAEILNSRISSTALLLDHLSTTSHQVKTIVSASAIGYYGFGSSDQVFDESSPPGDDFLANVVRQWEQQVDRLSALNIRVVKIRIGIVLSAHGGAMKEMAKPIRFGVGAAIGTGQQMLSWIHIDDACRIFMKAMDDETMSGPYNAVAPHPVSNLEMTMTIAASLRRRVFLPNVPAFVLKLLVGGVAEIVLNGSVVSSKKIQETGFQFEYTKAVGAIEHLLKARS